MIGICSMMMRSHGWSRAVLCRHFNRLRRAAWMRLVDRTLLVLEHIDTNLSLHAPVSFFFRDMVNIDKVFTQGVLKVKDRHEGKDLDANITAGKSPADQPLSFPSLTRVRSLTLRRSGRLGTHDRRYSLVDIDED